MSPYDEHAKPYIQVGIAPINPAPLEYQVSDPQDDQSKADNTTVPVPPSPDIVPISPEINNTQPIVTPSNHPDHDKNAAAKAANDWVKNNLIWLIIVIILLTIIIAGACCYVKKMR